MKTVPALLALLVFTGTVHAADEVIGHWQAEEASGTAGNLTFPAVDSGPTLFGDDPGLSLSNDPEHKQVIAFDGTQQSGLASRDKMPISGPLTVTAKVKLESNPEMGRILALPGVEIRHDAKKRVLTLIVWLMEEGAGSTPEISIPEVLDEWITISGEVGENTMKITAGGETAEKEFSGHFAPKPGLVYFGMGAGRPFHGKIAEVKVTETAK